MIDQPVFFWILPWISLTVSVARTFDPLAKAIDEVVLSRAEIFRIIIGIFILRMALGIHRRSIVVIAYLLACNLRDE